MELIDPGPNPRPQNRNGAVLSEDGRYRYRLWRRWAPGPRLIWVMLNPSTADAETNDPTIRRCVGFAINNGCGAIEVINLFAYRTAKPKDLAAAHLAGIDIEGVENRTHWALCLTPLGNVSNRDVVVAAWGANARQLERIGAMSQALPMTQPWKGWKCLGFTQTGAPRHPLYVRADAELVPL